LRPSVEEIIAGMEHTFNEFIVPELSSAWAKRMAATMNAFFQHLIVRWQKEDEFLLQENKDLVETLGLVQKDLKLPLKKGRQEELSDLYAGIQGALEKLKESNESSGRLALSEQNRHLKELIVRIIETLEKDQNSLEKETVNAVKKTVDDFLKRRLKREREMVQMTIAGVKV
jgi:hypothetical protein